MVASIGAAASTYAKLGKVGSVSGMEPRAGDPTKNFSDMLGDAMKGAIETGRHSEAMSAKAVAGTADLREVVTAVTNHHHGSIIAQAANHCGLGFRRHAR